ncbi:integration host factor subunit beta [Candidatus Pelagibacter sp.]|nr:integration host factor subunit beta [Candidatus Pelagibacter sp.]
MAIVKSELIKELKRSYPNFLTRDLNKVIEIILKEIRNSLNRGEGVELRNFGTFRTNIQKASIRRNPKTGEKVNVPKKRTIKWKMSKDLFKKLNNNEQE